MHIEIRTDGNIRGDEKFSDHVRSVSHTTRAQELAVPLHLHDQLKICLPNIQHHGDNNETIA